MTRTKIGYRRYKPRKHLQMRVNEWRKYPETIYEDKYSNRQIGHPAPFIDKTIEKWRRQGWRYDRQPRIGLVFHVRNSHNAALCIALVTDLLLRTDPQSIWPVRDFTEALNKEFPTILWDQYTVGRILMNISDAAALTERENDQMPPLERGAFKGTRTYWVNASRQNWWWLGHVREAFGDAAQAEFDARGEAPIRDDDTSWMPLDQVPAWGDRGTFR